MSDGGLAKTSDFLLSMANVMVGPMADVFELTPELHGIGLVKNVQVQSEQRFVDLMQGLTNSVVASVNTESTQTISAEVFEYTARNLAYAAGIDASGANFNPQPASLALNAQLTDSSTSLVVAGSGNLTGWATDDWLVMQNLKSTLVFVAKVQTVNAVSRSLTWYPRFNLPTGVTWSTADTRLYKVHGIGLGTQENSGYVGVKIVGTLPDSGEPVTMVFPKARITRGLSVAFGNENFANMPFEFRPLALVAADTYFNDFRGNKTGIILKR